MRGSMAALVVGFLLAGCAGAELRGTNDLGIVIERATGSIQVIDSSAEKSLGRVTGLGDLSHAAAVYSRDGRYAYVFGRDGGLSKVDILERKIVKRVVQAGNSIGGAVSDDGRLIAVANYEPGGIKVFAADTLTLLADIPSLGADGKRSKVVGIADAPGRRFVYSLFEAGEIWVADVSDPANPKVRKFAKVGSQPYDGLITPDGRYYIAGLFGEDGLALLDLWNLDKGPRRILSGYGKGDPALPVYKMPHLRGWSQAGDLLFLPAIGRHEVLVVDRRDWREVGRIPVAGQPVFAMARPDGRQVWVNFALPHYDTVQVIDVPSLSVVKTLKPGKAVLHMEFSPRSETIWISARDEDKVFAFDTQNFTPRSVLAAEKPSGIFLTVRSGRIGM